MSRLIPVTDRYLSDVSCRNSEDTQVEDYVTRTMKKYGCHTSPVFPFRIFIGAGYKGYLIDISLIQFVPLYIMEDIDVFMVRRGYKKNIYKTYQEALDEFNKVDFLFESEQGRGCLSLSQSDIKSTGLRGDDFLATEVINTDRIDNPMVSHLCNQMAFYFKKNKLGLSSKGSSLMASIIRAVSVKYARGDYKHNSGIDFSEVDLYLANTK